MERRIADPPIDSGIVKQPLSTSSCTLHPVGGALSILLVFLLAACSGDPEIATGLTRSGDSTVSGPRSTTTAATESRPEEMPLIDALDPGGAIAPGRWLSGALATPVSFDVASPMVLLEALPGAVAFGTPDPGVSQAPHALVLIDPEAVIVFDDAGPFEAPFPADLGRWLEESPSIDVVESGAVPGATWWEIATAQGHEATTPCQFGDRCVEWLVLPNGSATVVSEPTDWRFRLFQFTAIEDRATLMLAQAPTGAMADLVGLGEELAASLAIEDRSLAPVPEVTSGSLASIVGVEPLPPGEYTEELAGIGVLHLRTEAPIDVVVGEAGAAAGVAFFDTFEGAPGAFVILTDDPLVVPSDTAATGVDHGSTDERDVGVWADQVRGVSVDSMGEGTLADQPVAWWDLEIDPSTAEGATTPCDFDPTKRCVHLVEEGPAILEIVEGSRTRVYVFADIPMKLFVQPNDRDPSHPSLDEILGTFKPLFDQMTIVS